jgi:hypothetical protein
LVVCRGLVALCVLPPFEGWDEYQHVAYVEHVRATGKAAVLWETAVPPALLAKVVTFPQPAVAVKDQLGAFGGVDYATFWARHDPLDPSGLATPPVFRGGSNALYQAQHSSLYYRLAAPVFAAFGGVGDLRGSVAGLRLANVGLTAAAVWVALGALRRVVRRDRDATLIGLALAAHPMFLWNGARVANDALGVLLSVMAVAAGLRLLTGGGDRRPVLNSLALGVLIGLAVLAKATNAGLLPFGALCWLGLTFRLRNGLSRREEDKSAPLSGSVRWSCAAPEVRPSVAQDASPGDGRARPRSQSPGRATVAPAATPTAAPPGLPGSIPRSEPADPGLAPWATDGRPSGATSQQQPGRPTHALSWAARSALAGLAIAAGCLAVTGSELRSNFARYGSATSMQEAAINRHNGRTRADLLRAARSFDWRAEVGRLWGRGVFFTGGWSFVPAPIRVVLAYRDVVGLGLLGWAWWMATRLTRRLRGLPPRGGRVFVTGWAPLAFATVVAGYTAALGYHMVHSRLAWGVPTTNPWYACPALPWFLALTVAGGLFWPLGRRLRPAVPVALAVAGLAGEISAVSARMVPVYTGGASGWLALRRLAWLQPGWLGTPTLAVALAAEAVILVLLLVALRSAARAEEQGAARRPPLLHGRHRRRAVQESLSALGGGA